MLLDIFFAILLILAIIKGYRRGLIVGLFSFVALIIGLAAAVKLSTVVAGHLGNASNIPGRWLPVISFLAVFIVVVLLIRLGANALEKTAESISLGWLNKLGGILLYIAIYITVYSVLLFYLAQLQVIRPAALEASVTYPFVQSWGPVAINSLGRVIPLFRDMFSELENFFQGLSQKIPTAT